MRMIFRNSIYCAFICFLITFLSYKATAQDVKDSNTTKLKYGIRYEINSNFSFQESNQIGVPTGGHPSLIDLKLIISYKKFSFYAGPKLYFKENHDSPYSPTLQELRHRIGLSSGVEYVLLAGKISLLTGYHFQYAFRKNHETPMTGIEMILSNNYYTEHLVGLGSMYSFSAKFYLLLKYYVGNLHRIRYYYDSRFVYDYFEHYISIALGYNLIK